MKSSMFAFATDLSGEGLDAVLENVQHRAGVEEITLAAAYHAGRDVFPHNPSGRVRYLEAGAAFFRPNAALYDGLLLKPRTSSLVDGDSEKLLRGDPLGELCEAAGRRGMKTNAWLVFLHNDRLGFEHPECATQNAFGDRYLTDLCPANPEVRAYCRALATDVARYGVSNIFAESLHYHGLGHGYHHERYFEDLGAVGTFLLGLCFCEHCLEAASRDGVDGETARRSVREELLLRFEREVDDEPDELTRERLEPFGGEELLGYLDSRTSTVTSLAGEVSAAAGEHAVLIFLDISGAEKGFATGKPEGGAAPGIGWRMGIDVTALAGACDAVEALGYAADPTRVGSDLAAYRTLIGDPSKLGLLLRPMPPDNRSAENLADKLSLARDLSLARADFYHYGFCRLNALDRVRRALSK
ncbi:MAG: hypothetical protein M3397_08535 [Actinomycetota bacterium]|jgi:hypothetical protein|nr:hypothetical protein [Rubrobacter sp.]MDQ3568110.1 hypothetical protein [Actinomycetota bacterium]